MTPIGFIYKTTCDINGKIYIGKHYLDTTDKKRTATYLGSGLHILRAVKKYGKEHFSRKILKICYSDSELNEQEIYFIDKFNSRDKNIGYNISEGGEGFKSGEANPMFGCSEKNPFYGKHHTEETKKKISEANKGMVSWCKGKKGCYSDETRRKMSESAKRRMANPENNPMYGKHHSEESKLKNRISHIGVSRLTEEGRKKISNNSRKHATGRKLITDGIVNKWLKPGENLPSGFRFVKLAV